MVRVVSVLGQRNNIRTEDGDAMKIVARCSILGTRCSILGSRCGNIDIIMDGHGTLEKRGLPTVKRGKETIYIKYARYMMQDVRNYDLDWTSSHT